MAKVEESVKPVKKTKREEYSSKRSEHYVLPMF
jgi:hypothetical protein